MGTYATNFDRLFISTVLGYEVNPVIMVDFRINWTLQIGEVRKPSLPFPRLVGTVSNCADAVRL